MAELIGGSGYDDVQNTAPSNPSIGDTWLDTNPNGDADSVGKIYADLGSGADWQVLPVLDELQSGRTRELLLLLQDKPVPEVQDPLNIQSGLSDRYLKQSNDYIIGGELGVEISIPNSMGKAAAEGLGYVINPNETISGVVLRVDDAASEVLEVEVKDISTNTVLKTKTGSWASGEEISIKLQLEQNTEYAVYMSSDRGDGADDLDANFPYTSSGLDVVDGYYDFSRSGRVCEFDRVTALVNSTTGYITDRFTAPENSVASVKQWNAIQARDVTVGGSTSPDPVEFEILDSTDTALNSTRIPKARIADEPFTMRNRVYSEDAGSNGQSDFTIATTGDGGHFGIPILIVVSVKKNGSVLNSANWSFDRDTDTVTIDTSNVSITSGDTIEIKYDFDVFDSTLQPRAYLNRASTSETSPSISHFRYEYVI